MNWPGAYQVEPSSPLISWVNPFPSRFINRTIFFCYALELHEYACCLLSFLYFHWLFPPSARESSSGNSSIYKSTRERVDSKGLCGRWRLHLMGSWIGTFRDSFLWWYIDSGFGPRLSVFLDGTKSAWVEVINFALLMFPLVHPQKWPEIKKLGSTYGMYGYHQRETPVPVCSPKLSPVGPDGVDICMGDHLDRIPCVVPHGKSGWRSGHQSRLPPLLRMLYVDWVSVDLNLTSRVFSGHSGFLPHQNWLPV